MSQSFRRLTIQSIAAAVWQRPELVPLREPVEAALKADSFFKLVQDAFQQFADASTTSLPEFLDEGFIRMPSVQEQLADYVVRGQPLDLEQLSALYAKRFLNPAAAPELQAQLEGYLKQVRETFAADPTYGPILLARDVQAMSEVLQNLRGEMHGRFDEVIARFDALLKEPEIKALVERKSGGHIFLSYTCRNLALALKIRNALEDAGHKVWQDKQRSRAVRSG